MEAEGFALDPGSRFDRDATVRPLNLRIARRRGLQGQINEILVLRCAPFLERRVHRRGHGIRVSVGRVGVGVRVGVCIRIIRHGHVVLRGDIFFGGGFLRIVVAIIIGRFRSGFLGRFVRNGREYVQFIRMVGQETGHGWLLVMVVAVGAAAVGTV